MEVDGMNILLCDDNIDVLIQEEFVLDEVFHSIKKKAVIKTTSSSEQCLKMISEDIKFFDIVFLDIEMPEISGLELGRRIKEQNSLIHIIFVTSFECYSLEAYKVHPFYYIIKPLEEKQVREVLRDLLIYEESNNVGKEECSTIQIESNQEIYRIAVKDIIYIEKERNTCKIVTKRKNYNIYMSLKNLEKQLIEMESIDFFRCHQSYIVNMKYIQEYSSTLFTLDDYTCIPISRGYRTEAKSRFYQFLRRD